MSGNKNSGGNQYKKDNTIHFDSSSSSSHYSGTSVVNSRSKSNPNLSSGINTNSSFKRSNNSNNGGGGGVGSSGGLGRNNSNYGNVRTSSSGSNSGNSSSGGNNNGGGYYNKNNNSVSFNTNKKNNNNNNNNNVSPMVKKVITKSIAIQTEDEKVEDISIEESVSDDNDDSLDTSITTYSNLPDLDEFINQVINNDHIKYTNLQSSINQDLQYLSTFKFDLE
ncbi:hypothetical protein DFJ63DRAFT_320369 [Scheffersomyces coipomensis]|uniref:uncharacterized protein n=1 Tax=Scheffersomyces coipomensis TaxID=1788519 RepID=UPI00315C85AC